MRALGAAGTANRGAGQRALVCGRGKRGAGGDWGSRGGQIKLVCERGDLRGVIMVKKVQNGQNDIKNGQKCQKWSKWSKMVKVWVGELERRRSRLAGDSREGGAGGGEEDAERRAGEGAGRNGQREGASGVERGVGGGGDADEGALLRLRLSSWLADTRLRIKRESGSLSWLVAGGYSFAAEAPMRMRGCCA